MWVAIMCVVTCWISVTVLERVHETQHFDYPFRKQLSLFAYNIIERRCEAMDHFTNIFISQ